MSEPAPQLRKAQPADFVRAAWHAVKRGPLTVLMKLGVDFLSQLLSTVVAIFVVVSGFVLLVSGPSPEWVIGTCGILASGLALYLGIDAFVMGSVWGHGVRALRDSPGPANIGTLLRDGFDRFGSALLLRGLNFATRAAIIALLVAWALPLLRLTTRANGIWGSAIWLPASIFAVALTIYSLAAALAVLTVEMTAPSHFIGGKRIGEAIAEAAGLVLESPIVIYRVFITALSILLPALFLAWGASIAYALTFEMPHVAPLTALLRTLANLVLFASIGLFVVMLQYSFFAYYSNRRGLLTDLPRSIFETERKPDRQVTLPEIIPTAPVHRLSVTEILESTRLDESSAEPADVEQPDSPE